MRSAIQDAAANPLLREVAEPAFDRLEPGTAGQNEVHLKARMAFPPMLDLGMIMGRVVVGDPLRVDIERHAVVDLSQKLDQLRVLMPRNVGFDRRSARDVRLIRGERCAVCGQPRAESSTMRSRQVRCRGHGPRRLRCLPGFASTALLAPFWRGGRPMPTAESAWPAATRTKRSPTGRASLPRPSSQLVRRR